MTAKKLGIWMDHEHAHLTEFTTGPMETRVIESGSTREVKEESITKGERHMHVKEQHQQAEYYKKIGQEIHKYDEVVLFGPTDAKSELYNSIKTNPLFANITIQVEQAGKMTDNQQQAFIRKHFSGQ